MNKLLLLAFLVTLMALLTLGSEHQEEEEAALTRQARGAEPSKGKGKAKGRGAEAGKGKGKGKGKGTRRQNERRNKSEKNMSLARKVNKKGSIKKENNRQNKPGRQGDRRAGKKTGKKSPRATCTANATCLDAAVTYMKMMRLNVGSYLKQDARIRGANKTGGSKAGKKGLFGPTLQRIVKAGGGNKSNLLCSGSSNSSGALQLKNLTTTLLQCETTINSSCNTANFPLPNITQVTACLSSMSIFKDMVDACLNTSGSEACNCWSNSTFTNLTTIIKTCKISDDSKLVIEQLGYCKGNFSLCKTYEDEGLKAISACSDSTATLTAKAAALTANSAGLTAAQTTASTLANSSSTGRVARAKATTCAEVITKNTALLKLVDENPSSTLISAAAADVTNITVTCTTAEKASLTTQATSLTTAVATVAEELSTVQSDLETATGSTASTAVIAAAANSTSTAASTGRRNIVARHLMNRLNLN